MESRIDIQKTEPEAYKAMYGLQKYLADADLPATLKELIKIRASISNGCAYCIQLHTADALKLGEPVQKLFALSAWWESPLFDEKEKAALKLTDEITRIAEAGVTTGTYKNAAAYYTENQVAQIIMQVIAINAWNRIAISTHMVHISTQ
jgi:AhpD family alkylhydroperoxidase